MPEKPEDQLTTYVPQANTGWTPVDVIEVSGKYADTFPVVTNETPLEGMLSQMDDPLFYMAWMRNLQWYYPYENDRYGDRAQPTLERIMKGETWGNFSFHVPVNFLRKTGPGQYYTVCKQKDGGYVYIFFDRKVCDIGRNERFSHWGFVCGKKTDLCGLHGYSKGG